MFFIKKTLVPWWEAIVDPWIRSNACIRSSMGGTPKPVVDSNVIHTGRLVRDVTVTSRARYQPHTRGRGV